MSKEAVIQMLSRVDAEPELRDELSAAMDAPEGRADAVMAVAGKHGYEFTPEEFRDVVSEAAASSEAKGEVSDADLERVAGGIIDTNTLSSFSSPTLSLAYKAIDVLMPGGTISMEGPGRP
jgi:predicted ribosomally synthesized peptide with nif11-like leader